MLRAILLIWIVSPLVCYSQNDSSQKLELNTTQIFNYQTDEFDSENYELQKEALIGLSLDELINLGWAPQNDISTSAKGKDDYEKMSTECFDPYIPVDGGYTAVPRNDDGSLYIPNIGFTFSFCGTSYTDLYINTNGNLSFGQAVGQFSPSGFPYNVPMVAPFWADVDTRNTSCGQAWYQLFGNYMIVTWENVGWYNQQCNPLNTFQVIISDGNAPIIGVGNNIQFRYGDMNWTTGQASGGGPFGGSAATVGFNSGDNVNYEQIGRFSVDGSNYDGPTGTEDGVHWLDNKCFAFDSGVSSLELSCMDITRSLNSNCEATITVDEIATSNSGCSTASMSLDISTFDCSNAGVNVVTVTATNGNQTLTCQANVTITTENCPMLSIDPVGPLCESDPGVALNGTPGGGSWSGATTTGFFDPGVVGPGTHNVTYTNPSACPPVTDMDIVVLPSPDVSIGPDPAEFCEEVGFVELTATGSGGSGGYTYVWNTPIGSDSGPVILATAPGDYTVTISDGGACTREETVTVFMNLTPTPFIDDPGDICVSEPFVILTATPPGGTWSGASNNYGEVFPSSLGEGTHTVFYNFTDEFGCMGEDVFNINIVAEPVAIPLNDGPYCEGDWIQLYGSTNVAGPVVYVWSGPGGYSSFEQNPSDVTEPGIYTLEVIANGCTSQPEFTEVVIAPLPIVDAFNNGPYCEGEFIELFSSASGGSVVEYYWTGPGGYTSNEQNPTDATAPGFYSITVVVDGCPSEEAFTEVQITQEPIAIADNGGPYCENSFIELFGDTPGGTVISYSWTGPGGYTSDQQNPVDATEPGVYTLSVNVDGCESQPQSTTVEINQIDPPFIVGDDAFCEGTFGVLDAGPGYDNYVWSDGTNGQVLVVTTPGLYTVVVSNAIGCTNEASYNVDELPNPIPDIAGSDTFCNGSTTTLDAGPDYTTYIWSTGATSSSIDVGMTGTYSVTVTDANGCTGEVQIDVAESQALNPTITGELLICDGGDASLLDAGAGYNTYLWSDGSDVQSIFATTPGIYSVTVTDGSGCTGETSAEVMVAPPPSVSITGNLNFCFGDVSFLEADPGFVTYVWSDGSGDPSLFVDSDGLYSVTVTDANGCTAEDAVTVEVNPLPEPVITGPLSFCTGTPSSLDAGAGYTTYVWSDGSGTQTITAATGGVYSVTVTDANGCTGETDVVVQENASLEPVIDGTLDFCENDFTTIDAGSGYETYIWSEGSVVQILNIDTPGEYSVTVSDANGCTGETSVTIVQNNLPTVAINGNAAFCEGDNSVLDAGGPFETYVWSEGSTSQSITVDATGTYSVVVTDANGCTNETSINVTVSPLPEPEITGLAEFCEGNSVSLDAGGPFETYIWSEGSSSQTIDVDAGNTYTVTVTDANGCTGEAAFELTENPALTPTITGTLGLCAGENSVLNAGVYTTYLWSDGSTDPTLEVDETGSFSVTVTDDSGCTGETSVDVVVNDLPVVNIAGNNTFCEGENVLLDAGGPFETYDWSDSSSDQTLIVTASGTYSVTVTDANGCTNEAALNVVANPNPEPVIAGSTTFCEGSSATLDAGTGYADYVWSDGSGDQTISVDIGNTYFVTVTDDNGCTGVAQTTVTESSSLNPVISGGLEFCAGGNTLLDAGAGFETYTWSDGTEEQTLAVNAAGDYGVTVTDDSGCTGETTVSVIINDIPAVNVAGNTPFCEGEMISLDAGDGFESYSWSDLSLNQTIDVATSGTYSVTVTDANGCTNETSVDVLVNPIPEPDILGVTAFCTGSSVELNAGVYESYDWSEGSSTQIISIDEGGTYSVTVTDANGCTGETQLTVTENQSLEPEISGPLDYCEGETVELTASAGFEYVWSTGATSQSITVNEPGVYEVLATDANGCSGTTEVTVVENALPEPQISGSTTFCIGTSTILDAGAGYETYVWSDGSLNQTLEVTDEGTYSVVVTTSSGCSAEAELVVTQSSSLSPVIVGDLNLCEGESSLLDAGTGFETYQWSNGATSQTIDVNTTGLYSVTVSDASGCTGEDTADFLISPNPSTVITGIDNFCEGETPTLDAGAGFETYLWSDGSTTQTILATATNTYSVTVTNANDCTAEASIAVVQNPNPVVSIEGPTSFCEGNDATLTLSDVYDDYIWSTGATSASIVVVDGGTLGVTVTDSNGCTGEASLTVTENTSLTPQISGLFEFCDGDNTLLDAGSGFETYLWTTGETSQTITVSESGDFGVVVTDAAGCSGETEINVDVISNPEPIIAGSTTFCVGSSTTLDAGAYSSYLWSDGSVTSTITTDVPGDYSVTVTNAAGCVGEASVSVEESSSLNPIISGPTSFCEGGNTVLDAGSGFETYLWSDGTVAQTLDITLAGDYGVTVSDASGCTGETVVNVAMIMPPVADLLPGTTLCNTEVAGSVVNLYDLIVSGDMTGTWDDVDNSGALGAFDNLNFESLAAGNYNFEYTTSSAISPCEEATYMVVITVEDCSCPDVSFFNPDPICNSDGMIDMASVINTNEAGFWSIQSVPAGSNPADLAGDVFDASGADAGEYVLEFTLLNPQPTGCPSTFTQLITVDQEVTAGIANAPTSLCADNNQLLSLGDMIVGADPGGVWTETSANPSQGGAFDPATGTFNTLSQTNGTYTFEYTVNGALVCPEDVEEVSVTINELPTAIAGASVELNCSDPVLSLNASGSSSGADFEIVWNGPGVVIDGNENTLTPNIENPGMYELVITNLLTGCSSSDMVEVFESADVPVALGGEDQEITCLISTATLEPGENYGSDYIIEWSGPGITAANMNELNPEVEDPGVYTLTITYIPTGCTSSPDEVIVEDNTDDPTVITDVPLNGLDCNIDAIDLIGGSPNTDVIYEWTDANGTVIGNTPVVMGIDEEGIYYLTVTDTLTGCSAVESVTIIDNTSYPIANAGLPQLLDCNTTIVSLDGSASQSGPDIVYSWTGPGIVGANTGAVIEANLPGMYIIMAEDVNNGCSNVDTVLVDQDIVLPNISIVTPEELDCMIDEVSLDGSGSSSGSNYNYQWQDATGNVISTDEIITVGSAGSYYLFIQNSNNGCIDSALVEVIQDQNVPQTASIEVNEPDCFGESSGGIIIDGIQGGTAPYVYSFDGSDYTGSTFYPSLTAGTYTLALEDANGCTWDTMIVVNEPPALELDLGLDLDLQWGDSSSIAAATNIPYNQIDTMLWTPADQLDCVDANCLEVGLTPNNSFSVTATLIDVNGCEIRDEMIVYLNKERKVYIPNAFSPNGDLVNDVFMVYADDPTVQSINFMRVFNRWGEVVFDLSNLQPNTEDDGWDGTLHGEPLNPAVFVYIVEVAFIDGHVELYKGDVTLMK